MTAHESDPRHAELAEQKPARVICAGCGGEALRNDANYCLVCGKFIAEDYQPLDAIRSSYRLQRKRLWKRGANVTDGELLFRENKNAVSETAWACVVYSMVPYLGIIFVPFAIAAGGWGYFVSVRRPFLGGGRLAAFSIGLSFLILTVQIVLWWLLYIIPELGAGT